MMNEINNTLSFNHFLFLWFGVAVSIAEILTGGLSALGIIVLATVTTTFLDAYSVGVSFTNIFPKLDEKRIALVMTVIGTGIALWVNIEQYENFLLAIGSVFAPIFALLLTEYFIIKNRQLRPELLIH